MPIFFGKRKLVEQTLQLELPYQKNSRLSKMELIKIGLAQRAFIISWCFYFLVNLLILLFESITNVWSGAYLAIIYLVYVVIGSLFIVYFFAYLFARTMKARKLWLFTFILLPLLSFVLPFIVLFVINGSEWLFMIEAVIWLCDLAFLIKFNSSATKLLKQNGFEVKRLGMDLRSAIKQFADALTVAENAKEEIESSHRKRISDIRGIIHDVEPLSAAILNSAKNIKATRQQDEAAVRNINYLFDIAKSLEKLMNNKLKPFVFLKEGRVPLEIKETYLRPVVKEVIEQYREKAEGKRLALYENLCDAVVNTDYDQVRRVISNLIENAIAYTHSGSVTVLMNETDDGVLLSIIDTGIGISEDDVPYIFEESYRVNESTPGCGVGLFNVKELCKLLDVVCKLDSKLGSGSTFTLLFKPALPAAQSGYYATQPVLNIDNPTFSLQRSA